MLNFVICDDNLIILDKLAKMLESIFIKHNYDANIALKSNSPKEILDFSLTNHVDVFILDINLQADISGLELAQKLRENNKQAYIIFTTGHLEYALVAYKVKTFDYIAKPITIERLEETIKRLYDDINFEKHSKYLALNNKTYINQDDIECIKKDGMKLVVYTDKQKYEAYASFSKVEPLLTDNFIRCHKSYIANVDKIKNIETNYNTIKFDNSECFIGPKYKNNFMEVLNKNGNFTNNLDSFKHTQ